MAAFAVISVTPNSTLEIAVAQNYPFANLRVSETVWLIADSGVTTEEVCSKIGIKPEGIGGAIVLKIENYYGFAPKSIWEWLKVKGGEA